MTGGHQPSTPLATGARVYTHDHRPLGRVREVRPHRFEVEPPHTAAYWLSTDCIHWAAEGLVLLELGTEDLAGYQIEYPDGAGGADSPDVGGEH